MIFFNAENIVPVCRLPVCYLPVCRFIALISNCSQIILIIIIQLCKVIILSECICDIGIWDSDICKN